MFRTIEDLMYINDGIKPYGNGLGYKPSLPISGGMIGGMAHEPIDKQNHIVYEYIDDDNKYKDIEIDDLIKLYENKKIGITRLLNEGFELLDKYEEGINFGRNDLQTKVYNDIGKIYENINKEDKETDEYKEFKKIAKKIINYDKDKPKYISKKYKNPFYDEIEDKGIDKAEEVKEAYLKGKTKDKTEIKDKYADTLNLNEKDQDKWRDLKTDEQKAEFIKNRASIFEKGNISEDELIDNPALLTIIDRDNSKLYNTKEFGGYNPEFIQTLKDFGRDDEYIKNKILSYVNIDGIKDNTIWELKAFGKNSYTNNENEEGKYSTAKFLGGTTNFNDINKKSYKIDYFIKKNGDKVKNIGYKISSYGKILFKGNILKENPNGYNYYVLENNKDGIQYYNIGNEENFDKGYNQIKSGKEYVNILNKDFTKFSSQFGLRNKGFKGTIKDFINSKNMKKI